MSLWFLLNSISNILISMSTSHFSGTFLFGLIQGTPDLEVVGGLGAGFGGGGVGYPSLFQPSLYQYSEFITSGSDKAERISLKFLMGLATAGFGCLYEDRR